MFTNTVRHLNLITCSTGTSYHYRLFINITVCHVTSLMYAKACKQFSMQTRFGLASGPLALLTHKTDVL
jgi:hypothetical protein